MIRSTDFDRSLKAAKVKGRLLDGVVYLILGIWAVCVLFPFYFMILNSFKSYGTYNSEFIPKFYTTSPTLENYVEAFKSVPLLDYLANTFIFTVLTTALMLIITIPAAYAFARMNFRGKEIVFVAFLALMMLPQLLSRATALIWTLSSTAS